MLLSCPFQSLLVVEDGPIDAWIISRVVEKMRLCKHITVVRNGLEALNYLSTHRYTSRYPQVILLDLLMPEMTGFEFLDKALQDRLPVQHSVKTVMLTCSLLPVDQHQAAQYPLAGYLHKPLIPAELLAALRLDEQTAHLVR